MELTAQAHISSLGVCESNQTKGVSIGAEAGVSLDAVAGMKDEDPMFSHNLFVSRTRTILRLSLLLMSSCSKRVGPCSPHARLLDQRMPRPGRLY